MDLWRHFAPPPKRHIRLHPKLWIGFAFFCIACVGIDLRIRAQEHALHETQTSRRINEQRVWQTLEPVYARGNAIRRIRSTAEGLASKTQSQFGGDLLRAVVNAALRTDTRPTRREVEASLNGGRPLCTQRLSASACEDVDREFLGVVRIGTRGSLPPVYETATYLVPQEDLTIELIFSGDRLIGGRPHNVPPIEEPFIAHVCMSISRLYVKHAGTLWFGLLALTLILRRDRVLLAELLLMVGILAMIAALPSLYNVRFLDVANDQDLPWGFCKVLAALALLSFAYYRTQFACAIFCPVCDYNLRANTNGVCSECGARIPPEIRERLAQSNRS